MVPNSQHGLGYNKILFNLNGWISVHSSFDFFLFLKVLLSTRVSGPDYSTILGAISEDVLRISSAWHNLAPNTAPC